MYSVPKKQSGNRELVVSNRNYKIKSATCRVPFDFKTNSKVAGYK